MGVTWSKTLEESVRINSAGFFFTIVSVFVSKYVEKKERKKKIKYIAISSTNRFTKRVRTAAMFIKKTSCQYMKLTSVHIYNGH